MVAQGRPVARFQLPMCQPDRVRRSARSPLSGRAHHVAAAIL